MAGALHDGEGGPNKVSMDESVEVEPVWGSMVKEAYRDTLELIVAKEVAAV
ncbi:MAG: hypothetical protein AAGG44_05925 [Planctomycetota bacterium]